MTELPAWTGDSTLEPSQITWLPSVAFIGTAHRPYPDGEDALFFAGTSRVGKLRITDGDFTIVDEIYVPGYDDESISSAEIRRVVKEMESARDDEGTYLSVFKGYIDKIGQSSASLGNGVYTVMDQAGNYYIGWGTTVHKVADERPDDIYSPLKIVASYDIRDGLEPDDAANVSRIFGFGLTYDGHVATAMPGVMAILDSDLGNMQYILLEEGEAVDNGISIDDQGGIYCVTSKYMRKVVWDGTKLSDSEDDGAWKCEYDYVPNPKALSRGSGNTPTLMGFGPDEDRLVIIADAGDPVKIVAMWRDEIPDDFEQKPGTKSRRIADQLALTIDVPATIEWSPHVYGDGVMMMASAWPDAVYDDNGNLAIFETVMTAGVTRVAPVGAEKWSWSPETRSFTSDWTADHPLQWGLHPVSATTNTVTLTALNEGVYSLVALDWDTGEEQGTTVLGSSPIFNTAGGLFIPLNDDETFVTSVFGPVKITHTPTWLERLLRVRNAGVVRKVNEQLNELRQRRSTS
ncbi:MAG: hypothetical protein ACR2QO_14100 [Acidimicrobiales bacterium]